MLKYFLTHKWLVLKECWKYRLYWQGITHDLGKVFGREVVYYLRRDFEKGPAIHHQKSRHHWRYYLKGDKAEPMPEKYVLEMFCDWKAAAKQQGNDLKEWYEKNKKEIKLHSEARKLVEKLVASS